MGRYISAEELLARFPNIGKWNEGRHATIESYCIYYAEGQLDGLLGGFYSTPFSAAHPVIKDLTLQLSYYKILLDLDPVTASGVWDTFMDRIDRLQNYEELISTDSGTVLELSGPAMEVKSNTMDYHPVHGMLDAESEYTRIDSSQLYDERDARD
jgi:hypothetical protein